MTLYEDKTTVRYPQKRLNLKAWALAMAAAWLVAACAPQAPTQTIEERAQARWDLLMERDFEGAWAYMTPGFRETTNQYDYARDMAGRPIRWLSATVSGKNCEEDVCKISVLVEYRAVGAPSGMGQMRLSRTINETWIRLDDEWWFVQN